MLDVLGMVWPGSVNLWRQSGRSWQPCHTRAEPMKLEALAFLYDRVWFRAQSEMSEDVESFGKHEIEAKCNIAQPTRRISIATRWVRFRRGCPTPAASDKVSRCLNRLLYERFLRARLDAQKSNSETRPAWAEGGRNNSSSHTIALAIIVVLSNSNNGRGRMAKRNSDCPCLGSMCEEVKLIDGAVVGGGGERC